MKRFLGIITLSALLCLLPATGSFAGQVALPSPSLWTLDAGLEVIPAASPIGIRLASTILLSDDFNDNSLDTNKWTKTDSGTNVKEQNQRMEITGNSSYTTNGLLGKTGIAINTTAQNVQFTASIIPNTGSICLIGLKSALGYTGYGAILSFNGLHLYIYTSGGTQFTLSPLYVNGDTYNVRITLNAGNWIFYVSSPNDGNYTVERPIFTFVEAISNTVYPTLTVYSGTAYYDNVSLTGGYASASPTALSPWIEVPYTTLDASAAVAIAENQIAGLQNITNLGSMKYQYGLNNGALNGSWLTKAALLSAIDGATITDHTNSLQLKAEYLSDGTQAADTGGFGAGVKASGTVSSGGGISRSRVVNQ